MPTKSTRTTRTVPAKKAAPTKKAVPAKKAAPAKKATAARATKKAAAPAVADAVAAVATTSTTDQFRLFLNDLIGLAGKYLNDLTPEGDEPPFTPDNDTAVLDEPVEAVEDDESVEQTREEREAELQGFTVRQLQNALIAMEEDGEPLFEPDDIKAEKDKEVLIDNLLAVEFDDEEDGEDDAADDSEDDEEIEDADEDEDEDDEDEDEEYELEDLMKLSLAELRKVATTEFEINAADVKGKDKDTIANMIIAVQSGEDDEYEADEEEDAEGDGEVWTAEELEELSLKEVKAIADEGDISYTAAQGRSKAALIKLITA